MPAPASPALARIGGAMPFGHQGGWDEALLVVVPLLIFAVLLRVAKRRAEAEGDGTAGQADRDE